MRNLNQLSSLVSNRCVVFGAVVVFVGLMGCESLRPHDEVRLKIAQEAAEEAAALTAGGGAVFGPMEGNLDTVKETQAKLRDLTDKHEYEAFKSGIPSLTPDDIGAKLFEAMQGRQQAFKSIEARQVAAARSVNDALNRQTLVLDAIKNNLETLRKQLEGARSAGETQRAERLSKRLEELEEFLEAESATGDQSLEETLNRTKGWLDWIDKGLQHLSTGQSALGGAAGTSELSGKLAEALGGVTEDANASAAALSGFTADAQKALDGIQDDEPLKASKQLLVAAVQQTAVAEQERLVEFRRHLGEVKRLGDRVRVRDKISVCNLYVTALGNVFFAVGDTVLKKKLATVTDTLRASRRYDSESGRSCLPQLSADDSDNELQVQWDRLDEYVAVVLDTDEVNDEAWSASEFVGGLGILLFYERQMFDDTLLELAREQHRHSIRLSRINAGQRADLVHQLAQGLAIYYQGGVNTEDVAQLLLFSMHVGGIFFIGSQL